jgi:hypothetical protein
MNPPGTILPLKKKMVRRPLWKIKSVQDFLNLEYEQVMAKIQSGELLWAFNIGNDRARSEIRVLSHCVVELKMGEIHQVGPTRKLTLLKVINLILPGRDIRSTELKRFFSCGSEHIHQLAKKNFIVARKPKAADGPHSFTVFRRASVAKFLERRRIA